MMDQMTSIEEFLFSAPLYKRVQLTLDQTKELFGQQERPKVDGWCVFCQKESTFSLRDGTLPMSYWEHIFKLNQFQDDFSLRCQRVNSHYYRFYLYLSVMTLQKVGQFPSLATIVNDETSKYRSLLKIGNASEFHKAVGLAAHGIGVGSFVYLRRVFERLIGGRFNEFKVHEGWDEAAFPRMRMEDKIELLKGHLPDVLVENRKVYAILSLGIHELEEDVCLAFFDVLKDAIVMILEEDKKTQEDLQRKQHMRDAIAKFQPPPA